VGKVTRSNGVGEGCNGLSLVSYVRERLGTVLLHPGHLTGRLKREENDKLRDKRKKNRRLDTNDPKTG